MRKMRQSAKYAAIAYSHFSDMPICYGPVVAMETMQVALDPYQTFQTLSIRS